MRTTTLVLGLLACLGVAWLVAVTPSTADESPAVSEETVALYNKKCAMCHGKDGVAKKMAEGSADLNDPEWQKSTTVEEVVKLLKEGKGKMKGYEGKLTDAELEALAAYSLQLE